MSTYVIKCQQNDEVTLGNLDQPTLTYKKMLQLLHMSPIIIVSCHCLVGYFKAARRPLCGKG